MRIYNPTREYLPAPGREKVYLLLHGIRDGIDADYTKKLSEALTDRGESVLALQFPYMDRGATSTSDDLKDEIEALQASYDFLRSEGYAHITIIAKSLGGIVVSYWLNQNAGMEDLDINVMGYVRDKDGVMADALAGKLKHVVQGEFDRYGSAKDIRAELAAHHVDARVIEIAGADHSYRDPTDPREKPAAHQGQAIEELLQLV